MSLDDFTRQRLARTERAVDLTPVDLLRLMLDELERGETQADGLMVVFCERDGETVLRAGTYRAGLTREAQLVQLRLAERRLFDEWPVVCDCP